MPDHPTTESEWYSDGLSFTCTQCGNCCTGPPGYVWATDEELAAMASHLDMSVAAFRDRYAHKINGRWSLNERVRDGRHDCVFLKRDDEGKALCSIYEVRPTQCRTWPFWPENLAHPRDWQRASRNCPGIDHGRRYSINDIRLRRDATPD